MIPTKWALSIALSLMVATGLFVGIYIYALLSHWAEARLNEEMRRIRDRGESLEMADIVPPPVSGDMNGSVLYKKAESLLVDGCGGYLFACGRMRNDIEKVSAENVQKVEEWLEKNRACMAVLERGLAKSHFRIDVDYSDPFNRTGPNLLINRQFVELFVASAMLEARAGHREEAFDAYRKAIRLGRTMHPSPVLLISTCIYASCETSCLDGLHILLDLFHPTTEECRALLAELESLDPFGHLIRAVEGERYYVNATYEFMRCRNSLKIDEESAMRAGYTVLPGYPDPLLKLEQAWYLEEMARKLDEIRTPWIALSSERRRDKVDLSKRWYCLSGHYFTISSDHMIRCISPFAAHVDLARVALSLILHDHKHHDLPDTLAGLDERILADLPLDPYTGSDYHYGKRAEGGFVLYSVGRNLQDDKGERGDNYRTGDIVMSWSPNK